MILPISMEDEKLFPKIEQLIIYDNAPVQYSPGVYQQMKEKLTRLWWSRLIISVRGYTVNYVKNSDEILFHCDDAFIKIHENIIESNTVNSDEQQFLIDLKTIVNIPHVTTKLSKLNEGVMDDNPFNDCSLSAQLQRVFGEANFSTYRIASAQILVYSTFMHCLSILQERWLVSVKKGKAIRFEEDPEWQPDDRVVLFHEFYSGNRTWILTDFDRHILQYWRPNGSSVIFGDRFIEDKKKFGYKLCSYCGMLEQQISQFLNCGKERFCSHKCYSDFMKQYSD